MPRSPVVLAGAAVMAAVVSACGVTTDAHPVLQSKAVPANLTGPASTTTVPGPVGLVEVYLVSANRLVSAGRLVPVPASPEDEANEVLGALLNGPTAKEESTGVRTAITTAANITSVRVNKATITLDLSTAFAEIGGVDEILAIAQIVYSVTGVPGIDSVLFTLSGAPLAVPVAGGALVSRPLTRADYATLVQPGSAAPSPDAQAGATGTG